MTARSEMVRMIVFKKDGKNPQIGNAYVRFGSKKTGAVDNVGAGGMTATIDVATGHFHDAKIVMNNSIEDCPIHPDTGVPIDGDPPDWEQAKQQVLDVTKSIKQLELFGVDLAVTNDGIRFPEINRFSGLSGSGKIHKTDQRVSALQAGRQEASLRLRCDPKQDAGPSAET